MTDSEQQPDPAARRQFGGLDYRRGTPALRAERGARAVGQPEATARRASK